MQTLKVNTHQPKPHNLYNCICEIFPLSYLDQQFAKWVSRSTEQLGCVWTSQLRYCESTVLQSALSIC